MGTIRVHEFTSLDGVIDAPDWTLILASTPQWDRTSAISWPAADAILLGRNTYEMFEPAWSARSADEDPGAPFMNESTKYVVSSTLTEGTWQNSKIIGPYSADAIRKVKDEVDGGIYVSGSSKLVQALITDGLLDELHLFVYPVTRGAGPQLFPDDLPTTWSLINSATYDNGVLYLAYRAAAS